MVHALMKEADSNDRGPRVCVGDLPSVRGDWQETRRQLLPPGWNFGVMNTKEEPSEKLPCNTWNCFPGAEGDEGQVFGEGILSSTGNCVKAERERGQEGLPLGHRLLFI